MSSPRGRRQGATAAEVGAALNDLEDHPDRISAGSWPGHFSNLDKPGLYSWWVDADGARHLTAGLKAPVLQGRIYAGQTGATKWPSGKVGRATLASRVGRSHIRGNIRGSTFRLTLASALRESLGLLSVGPRSLAWESEATLTAWVFDHLEVAVHPFAERDALKHLEDEVLDSLDPPLNLDGRPSTPVRARLTEIRKTLSVGPEASAPISSRTPGKDVAAQPERVTEQDRSARRVSLHEEIADILSESGRALSTQEVADAVNSRGRYATRDGSEVTRFQIHGRTRNYPRLFSRDGDRVRLVDE